MFGKRYWARRALPTQANTPRLRLAHLFYMKKKKWRRVHCRRQRTTCRVRFSALFLVPRDAPRRRPTFAEGRPLLSRTFDWETTYSDGRSSCRGSARDAETASRSLFCRCCRFQHVSAESLSSVHWRDEFLRTRPTPVSCRRVFCIYDERGSRHSLRHDSAEQILDCVGTELIEMVRPSEEPVELGSACKTYSLKLIGHRSAVMERLLLPAVSRSPIRSTVPPPE